MERLIRKQPGPADQYCLQRHSQYRDDFHNKLDFEFEAGRNLLDVGCGDATDLRRFIDEYGLDACGVDVYQHENIEKFGIEFEMASIFEIPYPDGSFYYVFAHDVLHHIDEEHQSREKHVQGLMEMKRVTCDDGYTLIIEGNRYNPLFYPHVVKMMGHNHFKQSYFKSIVGEVFGRVEFKNFEAHLYPGWSVRFFKVYERIMEKYMPASIMAYNVAIARK